MGQMQDAEIIYKNLINECAKHPGTDDAKLATIEFDYAKLLAISNRAQESQLVNQSAWKTYNRLNQ